MLLFSLIISACLFSAIQAVTVTVTANGEAVCAFYNGLVHGISSTSGVSARHALITLETISSDGLGHETYRMTVPSNHFRSEHGGTRGWNNCCDGLLSFVFTLNPRYPHMIEHRDARSATGACQPLAPEFCWTDVRAEGDCKPSTAALSYVVN
ncbi:uncharacterized protein L969DRAFT_95047 [Mixia osmundae IAM 14324]|uniref:Uncharacterized protein n=1 Tax=Mixia osmundae (strain CBS 9802 / IAM 14324 / JCM 22182 / KY 12970) TaxID=764103 RepID=G7E0X8_MIXOS|nr:uncharacterized protein L969DRAFT_95047 [Mixia osmundae IAM 14324]KEI38878.1 hypothetical protein L969DRAFT_95047 [Mixia osmundae IAM 14324]GAA96488.1 hypothetical protein E5Q_03156 [Mixia osmundae IAM 14324]